MTQEQTELKQEEAWTPTYYDASGLTWRVDGGKHHIDGLAYPVVEREGFGRIYHVNGVAYHIDEHQVLVRKHHIEDPACHNLEHPELERHIPFFHEAPKEK